MKYDNNKWKSINPTQDIFREYTPMLRFRYKADDTLIQYITLYGQPFKTRKLAHDWILANLPEVEKVDVPNSLHSPDKFEPDVYVLHAGDSYGAKPSQIKSGMHDLDGNDWLASQDSRSIITKKIDHHLWRKVRNSFKKMVT